MPSLDLALTPLHPLSDVQVSASVLSDGSLSFVLWLESLRARRFEKTGFWVRMPGGVDVLYTLAFPAAGRLAFTPALAYPAEDSAPRVPDVWLVRPKAPGLLNGVSDESPSASNRS